MTLRETFWHGLTRRICRKEQRHVKQDGEREVLAAVFGDVNAASLSRGTIPMRETIAGG